VIPCNWKFPAENFGGDAYHLRWTHRSALLDFSSIAQTTRETAAGAMVCPGNGHGLICVGPEEEAEPPVPELLAYEAAVRPEVEARLGPRLQRINPVVGTVFPNFSFLRAVTRSFRVWQPRGPDKIELWSWAYIDRAAPPAVKEAARLTATRTFSPSGTFEQDDMDNWQECTRSGRGVVARRHALNTQMGLGHEKFDEGLGAWTSDFRLSESNHRRFYRRWAELMAATSWAEVEEARP
jgi:hypothetical protein